MRYLLLLLLSGFILFFNTVEAQQLPQYPQHDFINPLDIPLSLAGNFGELRSNHFHAGLDFRTNGEEGYFVKAIADGYVSRIKVSAYGYGNALYITHNNGYVSVYGHLQRYDSTVANYIKKKQYESELFEVDLFPMKNEIPVKQGQVIALSGNTGGSEGPHLHFEIRDEKTEEILNPFLFGFVVPDSVPPSIEGISVYPTDKHARINGSNTSKYIDVVKTGKNKYTIREPLVLSGSIGFGIVTYDIESGGTNKNGTYSYTLRIDSQEVFNYAINRFAFDQTRYINAHIDYAKMKKTKDKYQRCFLLPGNKIKHYKTNTNRGVFEFKDTLSHVISIEALDFYQNKSIIAFNCKSKVPGPVKKDEGLSELFKFNKINVFIHEDVKVETPLLCLYEDVQFKYKKLPRTGNLLSDVHALLDQSIPIHNSFTISIKPKSVASKFHDKLVIVSLDEEGNPSSEGGSYENGWVVSKVKNFGNFAVMMDTTAPVVKLLNFDKEKLQFKDEKISVKIGDNLSGIKSYRGTIDGQWVLMQHDNKEKTISYIFDEKLAKTEGEHIFVVTVTDKKGNSKQLSTTFNY